MRIPFIALSLLALMPGAAAAQSVGVASAVNQSAVGIAPGQPSKTMYLGDQIIHNQKIVTNGAGLLQILLADGTSFTVGPNSSLTIDSFVYDPNKGTAKIVADLGTGVFRFIGGTSSKSPDGVTLNTPVGTVGIQGGISNLDFSGAVPNHIDMVYGVGVTLTDGTKVIGDLYHSGYSIVIGADGKVGVQKTPPEWTTLFQALMVGNGKGGKVGGNTVADKLKNTNKTNDPPSNDGDTTQVASNDPNSPVPTWGQIDNSGLSSVSATYTGAYVGTAVGEDYQGTEEMEDEGIAAAIQTGLPFLLDFHFANRTGTAYFGEYVGGANITSDPLVAIPLTANNPASSASAGFGFHADSLHQVTALDAQQGTGYGDLNGFFLNTPNGVANGVAGAFDVHVVGGEDGAYHVTGAFGGNYTP